MTEYKRIQLRRDTSANWQTENPVLLEGEIGIDLTNNNIKIGDGLTAWNVLDYVHSDVDLSNYYTKGETNNAIQGTRTALEGEINAKVDNDTYQAKVSEIETNLEGKADKADTYTKGEVDEKIAGAGVSKEYVDGEISRVESEIPSLSGYATEAWVEGKGYLTEHQDISNLATKEELPTKTSDLTNDSGFLTEHQSLSNYYTKGETDTAIQGVKTTLEGEINTKVGNDTYQAKVSEIESEIEGKADRTEIPSLAGYATEQWVENKGYLTEHQQLKTINNETIVGTGNITIPTNTETWTFELEDGSTITKEIYVR